MNSGAATALTSGDWMVEDVLALDQDKGVVYFSATRDSVLEKHIYALPLTGGVPTRRSAAEGWHEARRSEEHKSELQSLMRNTYAVVSLKKKTKEKRQDTEK